MIYRVVIVVLIVALVVGALLMTNRTDSPTERAADEPLSEPGYAARDTEVVETGADGRELYRLKAELIRQRPDAGIIELERVQMDYSPPTESTSAPDGATPALWKVSALRGEVQESGERIRLSGSVNVTGPMPTAVQTIRLDTELLDIQPREQLITTDAPVTLTWTGQRLSSVGMIANLKDETVQLQSKVNGRFLP